MITQILLMFAAATSLALIGVRLFYRSRWLRDEDRLFITEIDASVYATRRRRQLSATKRDLRRRTMRSRRELYDELFWDE